MNSYEILRQARLFAAVSDGELLALARVSTARAFAAREVLTRSGMPQEAVIYLAHGSLMLYRGGTRREGDLLLGIILGPALFGDVECMSRAPWMVTARARDPGVCVSIPNEHFLALAQRSAGLAYSLYVDASLRGLLASHNAQASALYDSHTRVLRFLLDCAAAFGQVESDGVVRLPSPMPQTEMARALGLNRRTIQRAMQALEEDGVLTWRDESLVIKAHDRLLGRLPKPFFGVSWHSGASGADRGRFSA